MPHARRLLAICLAAALAAPAATHATGDGLAPALAEMPASTQRLAPVVARFRSDLASLERVRDITGGEGVAVVYDGSRLASGVKIFVNGQPQKLQQRVGALLGDPVAHVDRLRPGDVLAALSPAAEKNRDVARLNLKELRQVLGAPVLDGLLDRIEQRRRGRRVVRRVGATAEDTCRYIHRTKNSWLVYDKSNLNMGGYWTYNLRPNCQFL